MELMEVFDSIIMYRDGLKRKQSLFVAIHVLDGLSIAKSLRVSTMWSSGRVFAVWDRQRKPREPIRTDIGAFCNIARGFVQVYKSDAPAIRESRNGRKGY